MADFMFNTGKGKGPEFLERVENNLGTNSAIVAIPMSASGTEAQGQDLATMAAIETATGSIISVVEVFDTHMLTNAVAAMTPKTRPRALEPARVTIAERVALSFTVRLETGTTITWPAVPDELGLATWTSPLKLGPARSFQPFGADSPVFASHSGLYEKPSAPR